MEAVAGRSARPLPLSQAVISGEGGVTTVTAKNPSGCSDPDGCDAVKLQ
jgi:hypothetical protein